jgi:hypothetical protein
MYFSPKNGVVGTQGPLIAGAIPGQRKKGVSLSQDSYNLNALSASKLFKVTATDSQVSTTIQDLFVTPSRLKIPKINAAFTAITTLDGSVRFNIVVGVGTYETGAATAATGTYTLSGVPTDGNNNIYTINGVVITTPQATANSLTAQAAADTIVINAAVGTASHATSALAVITITANVPGSAGNSITTVGTSDGGDVVTANQAHLTGGTDATGIITPGNDNSSTSGLCTNLAANGTALFNIDIPITTTTFPGATTATGGSAGLGLIPTYPDAVFPCGAILTLRIIQPVAHTLTNFTVSADTEIQNLAATFPNMGITPAPSVAFGGVDF